MIMLREYEDCCNSHRLHRALDQAAPLRPRPDRVTDLDHFRSGGTIARVAPSTNIAWWHRVSAFTGTGIHASKDIGDIDIRYLWYPSLCR